MTFDPGVINSLHIGTLPDWPEAPEAPFHLPDLAAVYELEDILVREKLYRPPSDFAAALKPAVRFLYTDMVMADLSDADKAQALELALLFEAGLVEPVEPPFWDQRAEEWHRETREASGWGVP